MLWVKFFKSVNHKYKSNDLNIEITLYIKSLEIIKFKINIYDNLEIEDTTESFPT